MRFLLVGLIAALTCGLTACTSDAPSDPPSTSARAVLTPPNTSPAPPLTTTAPPSTPAPTTPAVPTTGPNTRPGEKPPVVPDVAKTNTRVGSDLYARYWISTLDWAYATMSSSLARAVYAPSCTDCARFLKLEIDQVHGAEQHYLGGRLGARESTLQQTDSRFGANAVVDLKVTQSALKVVSKTGTVVDRAPAISSATFRIWLKWLGSSWTVVDWKRGVRS